MTFLYRIEIDVVLDDAMTDALVETAREHYQASEGAWTEESGTRRLIPKDEHINDPESAILELVESAFPEDLPGIEPRAFKCGIVRESVRRG
jgi:hypothetical protein